MGKAHSIFAEIANLLERYGLDLALSQKRREFIEELGFELFDDADNGSLDEQYFIRTVGPEEYRLMFSQTCSTEGSNLKNLTFEIEHIADSKILEREIFSWIRPVTV